MKTKNQQLWCSSIAIVGCLALGATAQANNIGSLDTGAGLYSANGGQVDPNWTVSVISGGTPVVPLTGLTYTVPNSGFPIPPWLPNTPTSTWITYSTPTQTGGDNSDDVFQYQLKFTASSSGTVAVAFASDNAANFLVNGVQIAANGSYSDNPPSTSTFEDWTDSSFSVTARSQYIVDIDVDNFPQGYGNPTGANVEFSGNVSAPDGGMTAGLSGGTLIGLQSLRRKLFC